MQQSIKREKQSPDVVHSIKHVLAVMSGKGGVGKSSLTSLLASALSQKGQTVGILDADVTGPSIPRLFGLTERPVVTSSGIKPVSSSQHQIRIMSLNLLLPHEDDPVIWRGPIIANTVNQFWTQVLWGELDYLLVDLPPGTGDAPLTVMQQIPLTGVIVVSSPQELATMVVKKAVKMAGKLEISILGLVENMSAVLCPHCGEKIEIFGQNRGALHAEEMGIPFLGSLPMDPSLTRLCDGGFVEQYRSEALWNILSQLLSNLERRNHS